MNDPIHFHLLAVVPDNVVQYFIQMMGSGAGVIVIAALVVLFVFNFASTNFKWVVAALLFYISTLEISRENPNRLITPLEQMRQLSQGLVVLLLFLMLISKSEAVERWRLRTLPLSLIVIFCFELVYALRQTASTDVAHGLLSVILFLLVFLVFGVRLGRWMVRWVDVHSVIRALVGAGALLVFGILMQFAIERHQIIGGGARLIGTTGNAQHLAVHLVIFLLAASYMLVRPGESKAMRIMLVPLVGLMIVFLVWTGSRTGLLMSVVGLLILFRRYLGQLALPAIAVASVVFVVVTLLPETHTAAEHLGSTLDTRSDLWRALVGDFVSHPLIGRLEGSSAAISENSYLSTAARLGLLGLIPLGYFVFLTILSIYRVWRVRKLLGEHTMLGDFVIATLASLLVGAIFEGYLLETIRLEIVAVYIFSSMAAFLVDAAASAELQAAYDATINENWAGEEDDPYADDSTGLSRGFGIVQ